jgi:hypothetical protein
MTDQKQTEDWGTFKVMQNGIEVACGSGPYEAIKGEALHYAAIYAQDGPVVLRLRKSRRRTARSC